MSSQQFHLSPPPLYNHEFSSNYPPPPSITSLEESEPIPPYHVKGKTLSRLRMPGHRMKINIHAPPVHYDVGDYIHGSLTVTPHKSFKVKTLKILLKLCDLGSNTTFKGRISKTSNSTYVIVACTEITLGTLPTNGEMLQGKQYQVPFILQIPYLLPSTCCSQRVIQHARLPPSIIGQSNSKQAGRYYVESLLLSSGEPSKAHILCASTGVSILPSYTIFQTYIDTTHYKSTVKLPVHSLLPYHKPAGTFTISVNMPPSMSLLPKTSAVDVIPVEISFVPGIKYCKPPPEIKSIVFQLHCKTVRSKTGELTTFPCELCKDLKVTSKKIWLKSIKPVSTIWKLETRGPEMAFDCEYKAVIQLPLQLPAPSEKARHALVPTFDSCFTSRRYELEVKVNLKKKGTYSLCAPVTIVASQTPRPQTPLLPIIAATEARSRRNGFHRDINSRAINTNSASIRRRREYRLPAERYVAAWELKNRQRRSNMSPISAEVS